jgi:hypothetical protein
MVSRIRQSLGVNVRLSTLLHQATVIHISDAIVDAQISQFSQEDIDRVTEELSLPPKELQLTLAH